MIKRDLKDNFQISISGQDTWYDMNVPGSAMETFCKEGILPDPYYGMNEYKWTEFWKNDFDIRSTFSVSAEEIASEEILLTFYGIDTVADVFLNGKKLGHTENMHRTWVYQVKELVKEGENLLEFHIASPVKFIETYKPEKGREIHFTNTGTIPGSQYIRKAHSMFGWDWGNSNPDIELLAPIARLLHISLDILLSFHENLTDLEIEELIHKMDKMFSEEGFEKTYQWAVNTIKEYPNCNLLIWQLAVMLDSRRIIGMCENPDRYDEQINSWYEMALGDKDERIQHHAADSLFGFYLRKKNYEMAEKYLNYFSDYDPMKKVKQGQLYMEQGRTEEAFEMLEKAVFSEYTTLNMAFGIMITKALEEKDHGYARFLAEKMCTLASGFDMGKYNECAAMLNVVTAENNVEGTFQVAKQLLNNVDTLGDFQKSQLYKHMKFREVENPYTEEMKKELLEGFRNAEEFAYMKGYEPWEKLLSGN